MIGKVARIAIWVLVAACGAQGEPQADAFDGPRAFRDLVEQVQMGPRPAGSEASARLRAWASARLRQAGWRVEEHAFEAAPPRAEPVAMVNLIARLPASAGLAGDEVMLITHHDTKALPGFVGANDGASGVALLLEVARQLARRERLLDHTIVLFDGEEAFGRNIDARDGLYGSRALAARMRASGELEGVHALLLVDMLADADLNIAHAAGSDPGLVRLWQEAAARLGREDVLDGALAFVDDHTPFARAGLRAYLALIDFQYGERSSPGWRWHSDGDVLDGVSPASLDAAGELVLEWLRLVEAGRSGAAP